MKKRLLLLCIMSIYYPIQALKTSGQPRLAVIMIVDQFAYQFLRKLQPYFNGGLKFLLDNGVVYHNAYQPHGLPATATGFTAFNTGTIAHYHGIVNNYWLDNKGKEVACDDDETGKAAVFSKQGLYKYGKSARNIMVDGLSDQSMLNSQPGNENCVFAVSQKSRSAICLANKLGKAIWFDTDAGQFTSSKAYFDELPAWLTAFNRQSCTGTLHKITWKTVYPDAYPAYHLKDSQTYTYSQYKNGFINAVSEVGLDIPKRHLYNLWIKTPESNKCLLDLATACIRHHLPHVSGHMIMWIGLSSLDLLGHRQGPDSMETTDLILHLDRDLQRFFAALAQIVPPEQTLYVLSADHGVDPIPELMADRGLFAGHRNSKAFAHDINHAIAQKHGVESVVQAVRTPCVYLKETVLDKLSDIKKNMIINDIVAFLKTQPGICNAWSYDELINSYCEPNQFEAWYKNQLYKGRSGSIIFQPLPYYQFTDKGFGTVHETPYEFNTHIPLIVYQKGRFKPHQVLQKVWSHQVANTLAYILNVPKPSASTAELLPGLF